MTAELSPTGRALLALEAIQAQPGITGDRLAARLGVTDRATRRYVAILRECGIPVESISGKYGGYRIGRGARIPPLMFTPAEALGLVMAVLQGWHGAIGAEHPAGAALAKIVRVLPAATAAPVESMRRIQALNPNDAAAMPDPDVTAALARASAERYTVGITYRGRSGTDRPMTLDPWAVVVRHGRWYLLAWSHDAAARRVIRLDRIVAVDTSTDSFDVPVGVNPVAEVEDHIVDGWAHDVEVRIEAPAHWVRQWLPRMLGRVEAVDEGHCVLYGSTDEPTWYAGQLAAIEVGFTVVRPIAIREAMRELSDRLARAGDAN